MSRQLFSWQSWLDRTTKGTPTEVDVPFASSVQPLRFTVHGSPFTCCYLQAGSPSPAVVTTVFVVFTPMPHEKFGICECVTVADQ